MKKLCRKALRRVQAFAVCICMAAAMLPALAQKTEAQAAESGMNIYAMYLEANVKGESVLIESGGEYLLMDAGSYPNVEAIVRQLKKLNVSSISVYFSHMHMDHTGSPDGPGVAKGMEEIQDAGIEIEKMYLPDPSLAPESKDYPSKYEAFEKFMDGKPIEYLKKGSSFQVGSAKVDIIGPLNTNQIHPEDYVNMPASDDGGADEEKVQYTYYENNCSLVARVSCGKVKYLTIGDALEDEVNELIKAYGTGLKADILKLSHHGTGSGNTEEFLDAVDPSYTFAQNTKLDGKSPETGKWLTNVSRKNSIAHGMCYLVANEKHTLVYEVKNNQIRLYRDSVSPENMLTGWQRLTGGDGEFRTFDRYYFDKNGQPLTGVQKLNGKYYYFGKGGCMEYGNFDEHGKYQGWKSTDDGKNKRYYTFSSDKEYAYMAYGFVKIGKETYYFDKNGYKVDGKTKTILKKIGKYKYAIGKSGAVTIKNWSTIGKDKYYFDAKGRMVANKIVKIGKVSYYFDKTGKMARSASSSKKKTVTVKGVKYEIGISGALTKVKA